MINGIYHVRVASSDGQFSEGRWVVDHPTLSGNDATARYQGQFQLSGQHIAMRLDVSRHPEAGHTLFGPDAHYLLSLNGHFVSDSHHFTLSGPVAHTPDRYATLSGHWLGALE